MAPTKARRLRGPALAALLVAVTIAAYLPALGGGFVWDDDSTLTRNPLVQSPAGLAHLWSPAADTDYWPVTYTSFWVEWRLWGAHPFGYHATNLALHLAGALLLWTLLRRLQVPGAFLAAILFAVHPVNVESVAWISQRKNLLALIFSLLSILAFVRSQEVGRDGPSRRAQPAGRAGSPYLYYGLSLAAFVAGMLSKASVAMLPLVLLGLILWHRRARPRDFACLFPFGLIAAVLVGLNIAYQHRGLAAPLRSAGLTERLLGAGAAVWFYLSKALLPIRLLFVYPEWRLRPDTIQGWLPLALAAALTVVLWRGRAASRPILYAWAGFCLLLVPVMGLTDVYFMRYSLVADHYQHLALLSFVTAAAAGWWRWARGPWRLAGSVTAVAVLAGLTWSQSHLYADPTTLWRKTLAGNPDCWLAQNNLGNTLLEQGRTAEALPELEQAVRLRPAEPETHNNLGAALYASDRIAEAASQFEEAVRLNPAYAEARNNLGNAWARLGRRAEAIAQFQAALRLKPRYAEACNNLAIALAGEGRLTEAVDQFAEAVRLSPRSASTRHNYGIALARLGRFAEAKAQFEAALAIDPHDEKARADLAQLSIASP